MQQHLAHVKEGPVFDIVLSAKDSYVPDGERVLPEHVLLSLLDTRGVALPGDGRDQVVAQAKDKAEEGRGLSERTQLMLVSASMLAGDGPVNISDLEKVLAASEDPYGPILDGALVAERRDRIAMGKPVGGANDGDLQRLDLPTINSLSEDLVAMAKEGLLDKISGRGPDLEKVARIISQRQLSSVVLTGDQGVGKTAIPEGLAGMIADGEAPAGLENVRLMKLSLGKLSKKCNCPGGPSAEDVVKRPRCRGRAGEPDGSTGEGRLLHRRDRSEAPARSGREPDRAADEGVPGARADPGDRRVHDRRVRAVGPQGPRAPEPAPAARGEGAVAARMR